MSHIIFGIDPGLVKTGYGIIESKGNNLIPIACGTIKPKVDLPMSERLHYLHTECDKLLREYKPSVCAIEETFVNKNPLSALKLGMARGVLLMTPSLYKIPVYEYAANKIKKSVVGVGHADKEQIMAMIQYILPQLKTKLTTDSADALAIAICHANHSNSF